VGRFVLKRIRELRKQNIRQIAVICHTDLYWDEVLKELKEAENVDPQVLLQRGDRLSPDQPLVVLTRPAYVGGQEFDAVIAVGLEQGVVPPRIVDNFALAAAVEQQALREMYLSFTRARYRLMVVVSAGAAPSAVIQEAKKGGLIT
jgi:superfamily I DNA/RNA helicase